MSRLIIFDMDGTVVDSGKVLVKTVNAVRAHFDLDPMDAQVMLQALNDPDINSSRFFYNTPEFTPRQSEIFEQHYHQNCITQIQLYEGIKELLQRYSDRYSYAVATNAYTSFALRMLEHLEVAPFFKKIVGADMVQNPKPHPQMLHLLMDELGYKKEHAILIGDSLKDKRAALAAGIDYALVNWGFTRHTDEPKLAHSAQCLDKILSQL